MGLIRVALPMLLAGAAGIYLGHSYNNHGETLLGGLLMILGAIGCGIEGNRYAKK